ncbi:hypothetical protein PCANC_23533 [Puccinia coronata f. sp. avenae]|uniref:Uncharacterized protein n=1 Tax=Puccinia coronata f. sp. avenae TaxID=200324 RepID=A0A2N5U699_9BASI|nr:hypothetical protein PCANC_23533 [Puccinia coronata f. sp. avenae]
MDFRDTRPASSGDLLPAPELVSPSNHAGIDMPWVGYPGHGPASFTKSSPAVLESNQCSASSTNSGPPPPRRSDNCPFTDFSRVTLPSPYGLYNLSTYHRLETHQIQALLERHHKPRYFDRYTFGNAEFTNFYESTASNFANYCNCFPASSDAERIRLREHFQFMKHQYHSCDRVTH